ncbi:GNAT family N-acetyltransferase [Sulfitobacter sp. M57]|uniref:GNAT family N-acetyltransferase n=1 Tax=unclassified Sulfitobacter TaxID=196795 RepID=UPI0023E321D5|nr:MULTISPECIES: GNAT family N-acetyltransferase [unclassified Sulfitobacter]MDF3412879.1 GNAT family N-acetyltransferase [Sulfitobacter sp. KE5]MDF3421837.1 GNAT family N-acetyltransferase [Sulfitobacter sp. KE43]MDF3431428.1 GNAT family N-acetyltransferase [Sulfitobacter sp. KE42]MDF3457069.1 GNAT family N-acetyltransferase [Sulfitobacter sp. S74]MDF3460972.1 GNAT family N-acetyltransferase [Sulfitobacter sp. Ks18]
MKFTITKGFSDPERREIAALYWDAFAQKLHYVLGPQTKAVSFIAAHLNPQFALVARGPENTILGVAGFKTRQGALIDGSLRDIAKTYGWLAACWRAPLLAMVERELAEGVLLMDGICVAAQARGMGLGTALLNAIKQEAASQGLTSVRLDVISTNPRAHALYQREGFKDIGQEALGPFKYVFGFESSTKMLCPVTPDTAAPTL